MCNLDKIGPFKGEYAFLSNFQWFDTPMKYGSLVFITNEHFYQAMKFLNQSDREYIADHPSKGLKAKVKDLEHLQREDWHDIKLAVMEYGLRYKFSTNNPGLRQRLLETGTAHLIEYNWWGDRFWGVDMKTEEGQNHLGELLMKIRRELWSG